MVLIFSHCRIREAYASIRSFKISGILRDPRYPGCQEEGISLDPRDPGSYLGRLSWDLPNLDLAQ